jgi:hypothetical protein
VTDVATEAQKRARRDFVNRFAYGLGRAVARAKYEGQRVRSRPRTRRRIEIYPGLSKTRSAKPPAATLRKTIAFFVGLGEGISKRKKQQLAAAKRAVAREKK